MANSTAAFARGGPGGAFAELILFFLKAAVIAGLVVGIIHGFAFRRIAWILLVPLMLLPIALFWSWAGVIAAIPALILLVVATAASDITRTVTLRTQASKHPISGTVNRWPDYTLPGISRYFLTWIGGSYVFWAIVSLFSFELLSFLVILPVILSDTAWIGKFLPFLLPPLVIAILSGLAVFITYSLIRKKRGGNGYIAPFLFNISVLITFLVSADIYRGHLMTKDLLNHQPSNLQVSLFLTSILQYETYGRPSHASFVENGKTFRWSYSEMRFVQAP